MFPGIIILHSDSQLGHSALHPHRPLTDLRALGAQVLEDLVCLSQYAGELSDGLQCNGNNVMLAAVIIPVRDN